MVSELARLGVNIDHVATLRQLRGTSYPDILGAARACIRGGASQITVHLREDRRHIQDGDVVALKKNLQAALNLEMSVAEPIVKIALKLRPDWVCLVPEKRQEITTEGGLALQKNRKKIQSVVQRLKAREVRVSLFIEPNPEDVRLSHDLGVDAVELHTGKFARLTQMSRRSSAAIEREIRRIEKAARLAKTLDMRVHAGHGLDVQNVRMLAALEVGPGVPLIEEYNIGHFLVCRAVDVGLERAVREMLSAILAP